MAKFIVVTYDPARENAHKAAVELSTEFRRLQDKAMRGEITEDFMGALALPLGVGIEFKEIPFEYIKSNLAGGVLLGDFGSRAEALEL